MLAPQDHHLMSLIVQLYSNNVYISHLKKLLMLTNGPNWQLAGLTLLDL